MSDFNLRLSFAASLSAGRFIPPRVSKRSLAYGFTINREFMSPLQRSYHAYVRLDALRSVNHGVLLARAG